LPLFERIGRKTYLTPAGEEMLHCAKAITQRIKEAEEALAQLKGVTGGRLNVAVISAGDYFFPRVLAAFGAGHPGITFNLTVHNREGLLRQLADNLTDLAVMVRPPRDMDIVAMPFAPHPYVIVAAPSHPLARRGRFARGSHRERFVQREEGSDTWNSMREVFGRPVFPPQHRHGDSQHRNHQAGGGRRHGIAFLSAHTIGLDLLVGQPGGLDVQDFPAMLNWYLVHNRTKRLPAGSGGIQGFLMHQGAGADRAPGAGRDPGAAAQQAAARPPGELIEELAVAFDVRGEVERVADVSSRSASSVSRRSRASMIFR